MNTGKSPQPAFSIHAFQSGHHLAFTTVFKQYYPALVFFAKKIIQNDAAAEDIAQETLIKLWEKHAGFHSPYAIKSFVYITTRNACFNYMKRSQTQTKNEKLWSIVWDESDDYILNQLTRSEALRELQVMFDVLPPECGKIMRLKIASGLENQEIATHLGISIHTVRNQIARGIFLLKKKYGNKPLLLAALILMEMPNSRFESVVLQHDQPVNIWTLPTDPQAADDSCWHEETPVYQVSWKTTFRRQVLSKCASYTISLFIFFAGL